MEPVDCAAEPEGEIVSVLSAELDAVDDPLEVLEDGGLSDPDVPEPEFVEESSAHATPGVVTAPATPSATAKAPTRPMYFAYPVPVRCRQVSEWSELSSDLCRALVFRPVVAMAPPVTRQVVVNGL